MCQTAVVTTRCQDANWATHWAQEVVVTLIPAERFQTAVVTTCCHNSRLMLGHHDHQYAILDCPFPYWHWSMALAKRCQNDLPISKTLAHHLRQRIIGQLYVFSHCLVLPAITIINPNTFSMSGPRLRRCPNIETALDDRILFAVLFWLRGVADLAQTWQCARLPPAWPHKRHPWCDTICTNWLLLIHHKLTQCFFNVGPASQTDWTNLNPALC